ncbi:MAG: BamA/TamA family outer membrane protein [Flavisolibacter sp.]
MSFTAATKFKYLCLFVAAVSFCTLFHSCTVVKDYPVNRPFVYRTRINIEGKYSTDEKKQLVSSLEQQLHDSIKVRSTTKFLFWTVYKKPAVYDSLNASKSEEYMTVLLHNMGYYRDSISFHDSVVKEEDQLRTLIDFTVTPGKLIRVDSVWYNLLDSVAYRPQIDTLQQLTLNSLNKKLIKPGDPFSIPLISAERDRLSDVYRNNGFLRFSGDQLISVWDTVGTSILRFTTDPSEQFRQLEELRRRRENPTASVEFRLRPEPDSNKLTRYYVGTVRIFPDFNSDTSLYKPKLEVLTHNHYQFISYQGLFKSRKLLHFIYLDRGELYSQSNYLRTLNKLNSIGAWQRVDINQLPRPGQDTVDFDIRMMPAKKYNASVNLDVSYNQGNISATNLVGLGTTFTLINRNFQKEANQATTNFRYGVELASQTNIQTQQAIISHTIQFPRLVPRFTWIPPSIREDARTYLSFNFGYTDRIDYYRVATINTSWAYEFNWKKILLGIRFPNIEYNFLQKRPLLDTLEAHNASYKYIFNDGLIISTLYNFTIAGGRKNLANLTRISFEESGLIAGMLHSVIPNAKLYRFIKLDAEFTQTYKIRRSALAWRFFGGVGYGLPFSLENGAKDSANFYMPFFRQYYGGGPNSMRAWSVRKLGPGSSIKSFANNIAPDRFGDIRLELNGEYRFYITQIFGFPSEGALFTDIGNVWFLRKNGDFVNGEFNINRLWTDIAIGAGTGFRIDFGFLKARFDYAYKVKNPSPDAAEAESQNKWFYNWQLLNGQFQLGINYPF